ncbi:MAG: shikimate kinase [Bacteroidetes bacterium QS_8_68_15]|nr:MAG: shikimate kinase [Bacteroidetes bacterium QS_8_68_15]
MDSPTPNPEPRNAPIYLTGFMGSGKSTVGPLAAVRLGWRFLDLDELIAERAGRPIPAIFAAEGEAGFRRREAEALRAVSREERDAVVATGGGTLVQPENLKRARASGTVVYLRAPAAVLAERLADAAAERPLLQSEEDGTPLAGAALTRRIETLLAERRPCYERAHRTVDTAEASPEATAEAVAAVGGKWRGDSRK